VVNRGRAGIRVRTHPRRAYGNTQATGQELPNVSSGAGVFNRGTIPWVAAPECPAFSRKAPG